MKKNLLLTAILSVMISGALFAQIGIQNPSFEEPADDLKFRADGEADGLFNENVPGWWADPIATDCGRQNTGKPAHEGTYTAYGFNNDGGSIWALAGTVEDKLELFLSFYAWESWPAGQTGVSITASFAVYEGDDPSSFEVLETQSLPFSSDDVDENGWGYFEFSYTLPSSATGKNLLVGYDLQTELADDSWFSFDDFYLDASKATGIDDVTFVETVKVFPNPASDFLTIEVAKSALNKYTMYNIAGQEVLSGELNQTKTVNIQSLNKGVYFLKVANNIDSKVIKAIIE